MGFLHCSGISEAFIKHLSTRGPISVKAAANRYWRRSYRGYETTDEGHKLQALMALESSVLHYLEEGLIQPTNRNNFVLDYLSMATDITDEEKEMFSRYATVEEFNRLIIEVHRWDVDGAEIWFDPIVWRLTDEAKKKSALLQPFGGVDL